MKKVTKPIYLLVILALLFGMLGPSAIPKVTIARAHPALMAIAERDPGRMVVVIVQKSAVTGRAEQLARTLGGKITKDLHIINAFSSEMAAGEALRLAASPEVRWVSLDAAVESTAKPSPGTTQPAPGNFFLDTLKVRPVWAMKVRGQPTKGQGITVAVIDSGISKDSDFSLDPGHISSSRISMQQSFNPDSSSVNDGYGHGTHIAGIVGGNGYASDGVYSGIAPIVDLISLKISDENGMAYESDLVDALQWVYDNRDTYNIRVVNLSVNSTVEQSYHTSPVDAAAEILWFNGVVVVASAGNKGPAGGYNTANAAPANDPFIITVGASDEKGTSDRGDDIVAPFSAYGTTYDGFRKPDIIAPGANIISVLSKDSSWGVNYPYRTVLNGEYFRISGTSMAAPMVTGAVALLLQDEPGLTPDQVKYRLTNTGSMIQGGDLTSYPYLDVYAAVIGNTTGSANTGQVASMLLWGGSEPITWTSVAWNSVAWNSVAWNSVAWNSVAWNSVAWNSVDWGQ